MKFEEVLYQKKKLVMATILGVEMHSLGRQLGELAAQAAGHRRFAVLRIDGSAD